jgi:hypothetical protein
MYCQYCTTENFDLAKVCIACAKPLTAVRHAKSSAATHYVYYRHGSHPKAGFYARYGFRIQTRIPRKAFSATMRGREHSFNSAAEENLPQKPAMSHSSSAFTAAHGLASPAPSGADPKPAAAAHTQTQTHSHPEESRAPIFTRSLLEDLDRQSKSYREAKSMFASRFSRVTFILSCFAVAVGTGILGAWWMNNSTAAHAGAVSKWRPAPPVTAVAHPSPAAYVRPPSRVNAGELPYDGISRDAPAGAAAGTGATIGPDEQPYDGAAAAVDNTGSGKAAGSELPDAPAQGKKVETPTAISALPASPPSSVDVNSPDHQVRPAPRRGLSPRVARGKEIDRINQQAADELKKKTERRRILAERVAKADRLTRSDTGYDRGITSSSGQRYNTRVMFAQCSNVESLIGREQCKWKVCSGKWGRNGCPSYPKHNAE